jgi:hypothetical protein
MVIMRVLLAVSYIVLYWLFRLESSRIPNYGEIRLPPSKLGKHRIE